MIKENILISDNDTSFILQGVAFSSKKGHSHERWKITWALATDRNDYYNQLFFACEQKSSVEILLNGK